MKVFNGKSATGNLSEAVRGLVSPKLIIMTCSDEKFDACVAELEQKYPGIPSISCVAMGYDSQIQEKGVFVTAFTDGVTVKVGMMGNVSSSPARSISSIKRNIEAVHPGRENTCIIDFCSGNDAAVMSTLHGILERYHIQVMGATGDAGRVAINGGVYKDAMVYAVIKNEGGRIKAYKENIYAPMNNTQLVASKTDKAKYYLGELNGKSAKKVYMDLTGVAERDIVNQTFRNPLGKVIGNDVCIVSIQDVSGTGLVMYRQINDSDILTLLEMRDPLEVAQATVDAIRNDFSRISAIYSVNCILRYMVLSEMGEFNSYLGKIATMGPSCGLVGFGEHYNTQFVNQTMTCVVFE